MDDLRKALFRALEKSDINMLRAVLKQGVSLAYEEGDPAPVCLVGLEHDGVFIDFLAELKAAGADIGAADRLHGWTLMHCCVNDENEDLLPWLIAQGLEVNSVDRHGRTPVMNTVRGHGLVESRGRGPALRDAKRLLVAGADVRLANNMGHTALHGAVVCGDLACVELVLAHGANIDPRGCDGQTPLQQLVEIERQDFGAEHLAIMECLLAAGADIEACDDDGQTALACASLRDNVVAAEKLLAHGAIVDADSGTPLRWAVSNEAEGVLTVLLAAGARIDFPCADEALTPLGLATHNGYLRGVEMLLDHGADTEAQSIDGETPLLIAVRRRHHGIAALLLEHGADRTHADHYGNTAPIWAERREDARLIELLSQ